MNFVEVALVTISRLKSLPQNIYDCILFNLAPKAMQQFVNLQQ
ncbi:hypothetical protein BPUTEOMOX_2412 [methanotrophic endosymbiont of Bathymodiolus puteoserpentis (Logatchev)]|nr:hypothetical protein BPUTEOMOX_2412 [methanotrophic endosymbiont of Bathymodiolus puteoserpentis (Logatchev)]